MSRMIDSAVTLLPEPDSPTMPSVSPRCRSKLSPLTARTMPSSVAKVTRRSLTASKAIRCYRTPRIGAPNAPSGLPCIFRTFLRTPAPRPWIERIAEPFSDQIERHDSEDDQHARDECQPRRTEHVRIQRLLQTIAPARGGWLNAEAEIRERRFGQDIVADRQRRRHDDRCQRVRQQVTPHDASIGGADRFCGRDIIAFAQTEDLAAHEACHAHP